MAASDSEVLQLKIDSSLLSRAEVYPIVGKIISDKELDGRKVISLIHIEWVKRKYGKIHINCLEDNLYFFSFDCAASAEKVMQDGPWRVMGCFLCLQHWEARMNVKEVPLTHVPIWVQIHGLKLDQMTEENAVLIGNYIGQFLTTDQCSLNHSLKKGFLRIRVLLNCCEAIKGDTWVSREDQGKYYVDFKYERLADVCFNCGRFGHMEIECEEGVLPDQRFGPRLRAVPEASFESENEISRSHMQVQQSNATIGKWPATRTNSAARDDELPKGCQIFIAITVLMFVGPILLLMVLNLFAAIWAGYKDAFSTLKKL